jgi:ketosteroid isomerase-like protein
LAPTAQSSYTAFNSHSFDHVADITTGDWNHINRMGGRTRGRDQVLAELREVHSTFLKNVTDRIEKMDVRFASDDVAIATVARRVSTFTTPDGVKHENERLAHTSPGAPCRMMNHISRIAA